MKKIDLYARSSKKKQGLILNGLMDRYIESIFLIHYIYTTYIIHNYFGITFLISSVFSMVVVRFFFEFHIQLFWDYF